MIYIQAVRLAGGTGHQHIAEVRWRDADDGSTATVSRAEMVDFIANKGGAVYACGGEGHIARVMVVDAPAPYLRTHADGVWGDNLLALPRF